MTESFELATPDGRSLDVWTAGPTDGDPLIFHFGTPASALPFEPHIAAMAALDSPGADRAEVLGWSGSGPLILDELIAAPA